MPATFVFGQEIAGVSPAQNIRQVILDRLETLGKSRYWLVEQLGGEPSANTIYTYLRAESDITADNLAKILDVLELDLAPRNKPRK